MEKSKTQLIILGTGNAMATRCYNTCFALKNGNEYFLVDAGGGNGIFIQLEKAGISFSDIRRMFVTHAHTDHILGVIWVIRQIATWMSKGKYEGDFVIYAHEGVIKALDVFCRITLSRKLLQYVGQQIQFCEVADGEQREALGTQFQFFDIGSTKLKQFGFRSQLPDGKIMACLGDEPYNEKCHKYVAGVDWLLAEAFCLYADREIFSPYEKHHSTALDAGRLAETLQVKNLLLYHTEDKNLSCRKVKYTAEAAAVFSGRVFVPDDLEKIEL